MSYSLKRSSDAITDEPIDPQGQILDIPNNLEVRIKFIDQEVRRVVTNLCSISRKTKEMIDSGAELPNPTKSLLSRLELYLRWLETNAEITPVLRTRSRIDQILSLMFNPRFYFDQRTTERARQLYGRWNSQNWGRGEIVEDSTDDENNVTTGDDAAGGPKRRRSSIDSTARRDSGTDLSLMTSRAPEPNHPIFGIYGIMHGVVPKRNKTRRDWILDSRYPKREFKVFGHNNLEVGQWWAMQILALFHGAHGSKMGGISGNSETGAYSVVTAGGPYEDLDSDHGDTLYYSGSRSHDNTDPKQPFPSSNATLALKASLRMQKPVRVLRAAGAGGTKSGSRYRPTVGIRYDGLYHVVAMQLKTNTNGGLYEQFKLQRLPGQPALDNKARPTAAEVRDYYKREDGY